MVSDPDDDLAGALLLDAPNYVAWFPDETNASLGTFLISPIDGDVSGLLALILTDDGNPSITYSLTIEIIVNYVPQFDQFLDTYHVVENDVLTAIVLFSDPNGDLMSYNGLMLYYNHLIMYNDIDV